MKRFELKTYAKRKPKGKALATDKFYRPMDARQSDMAKNAKYYEIVDLADNRVIEIKLNKEQ